jgi:hypothetical protein
VTPFCTGFKSTPFGRAKPSGPGRVQPREHATTERERELAREPMPEPSGFGGCHADFGRAACRALTGGSPLGSASPPRQQNRTLRQAVPAATHPRGARPRELAGSSSSRRAFSRHAKITVKGRAQGRVLRMAQAPPLTVIFLGKISAPIGRTDRTRLSRPYD